MGRFLIAFIFISALLTRIYKLRELFYFTFDEEVIAFIAKRIAEFEHVPLIGGVTPLGVHVGPFFYWFSGLLFVISGNNPLIWGIFAAILGGISAVTLYLVSKKIFGNFAGLTASVIYSFSYLQIATDRHYWGLVFNPLIAVVFLYSIYQIYKKKYWFSLLLAATLSFGWHADPSTLVFWIAAIILWFVLKLPIRRKEVGLSVLILIASFVPTIFFELRHNFHNLDKLLQFFSNRSVAASGQNSVIEKIGEDLLVPIKSFARLIYPFGDLDLSKQYSYCANYINEKFSALPWWMVVFSLIIFLTPLLILLVRKKTNEETIGLKIIYSVSFSFILGIGIYGGIFGSDVFEHYYTSLFPYFFILFGFVLSQIKFLEKAVLFAPVLIIVFLNIAQFTQIKNVYGYRDKVDAVKWVIEKSNDKDFSIDSLGTCWRYNGYRYLFLVAGKEPVKSFVDPQLAYLYDKPPE
ncbi:MAG TPA: glycosyltransferase family 39 protein, partial [Patescibacteria group bacterium]